MACNRKNCAANSGRVCKANGGGRSATTAAKPKTGQAATKQRKLNQCNLRRTITKHSLLSASDNSRPGATTLDELIKADPGIISNVPDDSETKDK